MQRLQPQSQKVLLLRLILVPVRLGPAVLQTLVPLLARLVRSWRRSVGQRLWVCYSFGVRVTVYKR
eukprot:3474858-Rhodomonas_salina.1